MGRVREVKLLYKPFGLIAGLVAGKVAKRLVATVWKKVDADHEPPTPQTRDTSWRKVVGAAALQGATFAATRAAADRAGAKTFSHLFGPWPDDRKRDKKDKKQGKDSTD
jgi:Protein of unknown function (DUF4235)